MNLTQALFFYFLMFSLISCAGTPPKDEYVLTLTAIENAKRANADKYEPKLSYQAKQFYERALNFYQERNYDKAKEYFIKSRYLAEKAEIQSRVKMYRKGEIVL